MSSLRIVREPGCGPRNYVFGRRLHHGMVGLGITCAGLTLLPATLGAGLVGVGIGLMIHDRHDFPWLRDTDAYHFRTIGPRPR